MRGLGDVELLGLGLESAPVGLILFDETGQIALVNTQFEVLVGYGRADLVGHHVELLAIEGERERVSEVVAELVSEARRSEVTRHDYVVRHKSGAAIPVDVRVRLLEAPRDYVVCSVLDTTDSRRTERALRESEERLRLAQLVSGVGTFEVDLETGIATLSPELEHMYGIPSGSFSGDRLDWERLVHPDDLERAYDAIWSAIHSGEITEGEWRVMRPDGTMRWHVSRFRAFRSSQGRPVRFSGANIDVTELKAAEKERELLLGELRKLNADLEARVQERTAELSAMVEERDLLLQEVHHRVKNNLQVISSLINMQVRKLGDGDSKSALQSCQSRVQAIALIHETLYTRREQVGKAYGRVSLADYARSLSEAVLQASAGANTTITLELVASEVLLPTDKAIACGLILNELLTNAVKHAFPSERQGHVRLALSETLADARQDPSGGPSSEVRLVVSDDGVGMPPKQTAKECLGMRLVSTLVEQLDGRYKVSSSDRGTTIEIVFPRGATEVAET